MKKVILSIGVVALLAACGNTTSNEPAQDATEVQVEGTEDAQEVIPTDSLAVEMPADSVVVAE